jgi:hypothetical protein
MDLPVDAFVPACQRSQINDELTIISSTDLMLVHAVGAMNYSVG